MAINFNDITDTATPSTGSMTVGGSLIAQTGLLKGTGQNLLLQSNTFTNAYWTKDAQTLTASQSDPFGGSNATLVVPTVTSTSHNIYNGTSFISGSQYTLSIYVKASGYTLFYISDVALATFSCSYNLTSVTATPVTGCSATITAVSGATGWYRLTLTTTGTQTTSSRFNFTPYVSGATLNGYNATFAGDGTSGVYIYGAQLEIGTTANAYVATSGSAVYGTPSLSFSGVAGLGLQSDGSLYVQPAGTGALQAQATTSSTVGGNARGANAVDWQTQRSGATRVASGSNAFIGAGYDNLSSGGYSVLTGGYSNSVTSSYSVINGGQNNIAGGSYGGILGGYSNTISSSYGYVVGGYQNTAAGLFNFVGSGQFNSTTSASAVTTQSATMNGTTTVTLSGSNANIKVGQLISGTYISGNSTYVASISGTTLTLSQVATGSGTATLSFYTPHGVVVGGGNNQATGSYSFIGGGGDAGTAANRNTASGAWSTVVGGAKNTASGIGSFIGGGGYDGTYYANIASGNASVIAGGANNNASAQYGSVLGGYSNYGNGQFSTALGAFATARSITGNISFAPCFGAISYSIGVSQAALLVLGKQTTDATATVITSDGGAASGANQVILPNNSVYFFKGSIVAGVTGAGDSAIWEFKGGIKRGSGVGTTVLMSSVIDLIAQDTGASSWVVALSADTTNGGLTVTVTGAASTTIRWVCKIETTEMTY